jgi:hypothetical protein
MPISVKTLLNGVPYDTLRRVEQVKARLNTTVRRLLREETALTVRSGVLANSPPTTVVGRQWVVVRAGEA